jgi:adenylate cyclase
MPVRIYELLARKGKLDEMGQKVRDLFAEGLAHYRRQDWSGAISRFQRILALTIEDGPAQTFIKRCQEFKQAPPPAPWDGVYRLTSK